MCVQDEDHLTLTVLLGAAILGGVSGPGALNGALPAAVVFPTMAWHRDLGCGRLVYFMTTAGSKTVNS